MGFKIKKIKINKIIKYLILSDLIFWIGWGLISPVFSIFIVDMVEGGSIFVVGVAVAIYSILNSLLRIPIGIFLDYYNGEKDDFYFLFFGFLLLSFVPFGFIFSRYPWHIYILQGIHGVGMAMAYSAWSAIFTKYIDKGKEATEWGIDATAIGLSSGISGLIGSLAITKFGFKYVFICVGILGLISAFLVLFFKNEIKKNRDHGMYFSFKDAIQKTEE